MPVSEKKKLRKSARTLRDSFNEEYINHASNLACELLSASEVFKLADTILIYYPIKNEISPFPLLEIAKAQGKSIAFPLCNTENGTLLFKKVSRINDLKQTSLGLIEPTVDLADAIITPNTSTLPPR